MKINAEFILKYFSRKYINVWIIFLSASFFLYIGKLDGWQWLTATGIFALGYPIINIIEKIRIKDITETIKASSGAVQRDDNNRSSKIPEDPNLK